LKKCVTRSASAVNTKISRHRHSQWHSQRPLFQRAARSAAVRWEDREINKNRQIRFAGAERKMPIAGLRARNPAMHAPQPDIIWLAIKTRIQGNRRHCKSRRYFGRNGRRLKNKADGGERPTRRPDDGNRGIRRSSSRNDPSRARSGAPGPSSQ
jgi:hypothetical protein